MIKKLYFVEMKYLYLFRLWKKGYTKKYGLGIIQEIVEILTKKDDEDDE